MVSVNIASVQCEQSLTLTVVSQGGRYSTLCIHNYMLLFTTFENVEETLGLTRSYYNQ